MTRLEQVRRNCRNLRARRRAQELCVDCGAPAARFTRCVGCRLRKTVRDAVYRAKRQRERQAWAI